MQIESATAVASVAPELMLGLRSAGNSPQAQGKVVSQQFEAILLRQLLDKSMGSMMGGGQGSEVYGYMITDVLSQKLAQGGGLGLSKILEQQFAPVSSKAAAAATAPKGLS